MSEPVAVLLVDDHGLMREMLRKRLESEAGIVVVGAADNADEAVTLAELHRPDVVLMDIDMPGRISFDAARDIRKRLPGTRIVFLSSFFHDRYIEDALAAHASGYITKDEAPETVVEAVRRVAAGDAFFSDEIQSRMVLDDDGVRLSRAVTSGTETLTPRELEVLRYVARGLSKKEIAEYMRITVKTVGRHCDSMMAKLDMHDRVELARFAIRERLVEP